MTEQPRTRQDLYDRIRQSSKEAFILEEMVRLGFWPAEGEMPNDPVDEIRRRSELQQEINALRQESRNLQDEKVLRQRLRAERLAESRRKRQETKERRERERRERAEAWKQRQQQDIVFLGERVSGGLNEIESDRDRLAHNGLPYFGTAAEIATGMNISVGELRFFAFDRPVSRVTHYQRFAIAKKTGGQREISAPMPRLKQVQHWILRELLERVPLHDAAHGFRRDRSIVTNARPHVGADVVVNLDLKDFFPSISYPRIKGQFRAFGYSNAAATIFGLLCTESDIEAVEIDNQLYYVALGERRLPQGAPTSPALTNILCRRLDRRLTAMAEASGFTYTRYADDLTFSGSGEHQSQLCNVLQRAKAIVAHEGFTVHEQKTRVQRRSRQQDVTGIVVNEKLNVSRKTLKRFRAALYQIEKDGPQGKTWGSDTVDVLDSIQGFANFVAMVNPDRGREFQAQVKRIRDRYLQT